MTEVSYHDYGEIEVPEFIGRFKNTEKLSISAFQTRALPDSLGALTKLRDAAVSAVVAPLPESVGNWVNVKEVLIDGHQTHNPLPETVSGWSSLMKCNLTNCRNLTALPLGTSQWENIESLQVTYCRLKSLPEGIESWRRLSSLNLSHNKLRAFPESIGKLCSLVELHAYENRIKCLPSSIGGLVNIEHMDLSSNRITHLPDEIGELAQLAVLDLSLNSLTQLPTSLHQLKNLKELRLNKNSITELPDLSPCDDLHVLSMNNNQLKSVPPFLRNLKSITTIHLHGNKIGGEVELFGLLSDKLEELDLGKNNITSFSWTPPVASIDKDEPVHPAPCLEVLNLSLNQLESLPDIGNWGLLKLEVLSVENNRLTEFPPNMQTMTSLSRLTFSDNQISEIPSDWDTLEKLDIFSGDHNLISVIPDCARRWKRLRELSLTHNRLKSLPDWLPELKKLQSILVQHNRIQNMGSEEFLQAHHRRFKTVAYCNDFPRSKLPEFEKDPAKAETYYGLYLYDKWCFPVDLGTTEGVNGADPLVTSYSLPEVKVSAVAAKKIDVPRDEQRYQMPNFDDLMTVKEDNTDSTVNCGAADAPLGGKEVIDSSQEMTLEQRFKMFTDQNPNILTRYLLEVDKRYFCFQYDISKELEKAVVLGRGAFKTVYGIEREAVVDVILEYGDDASQEEKDRVFAQLRLSAVEITRLATFTRTNNEGMYYARIWVDRNKARVRIVSRLAHGTIEDVGVDGNSDSDSDDEFDHEVLDEQHQKKGSQEEKAEDDKLEESQKEAEPPKSFILSKLFVLVEQLAVMHSQGLLHGDIKPDNVLQYEDNVLFTDFGFSRQIPDNSPVCGVRGSGGYIPFLDPEVYEDHVFRPSTDIFAFGLTIFQLVSGRVPYQFMTVPDMQKHQKKHRLPPEVLNSSWKSLVSPECLDFISRCLAPAAHRPSARALIHHPFVEKHRLGLLDDIVRFSKEETESTYDSIAEYGYSYDDV